MRLLTYFLKSINILNLLLIAAVAALGVYLLFPLLNAKVTYKPPPVAQQTRASEEEKTASNQSSPLSDYMMVAEQNIFHPERKIPPENKDEKTLTTPEIFLYGTLLTDNMRLAYIEDKKSPQTSPGRGNRQAVVKQGDVISGYILKSVEKDRIVLVRGEEQMIVFLNDAKKTRSAATPSQPTGTSVTPQQPPASPAATSQPVKPPSRPSRTNPATEAAMPQQ